MYRLPAPYSIQRARGARSNVTWRHSTHNISQRRAPSTRWRTRSHSCGIARRDDDEEAMHSVGERLKGACAELYSQEQRKLPRSYATLEENRDFAFVLARENASASLFACPTCLHLISSTDRGRRLDLWSDVHVYASRCKLTRSLRASLSHVYADLCRNHARAHAGLREGGVRA